MLRAAVSYEVVRSRYLRLADFEPGAVNALLAEMHEEARAVVVAGAGDDGGLEEARHAYMRYVGQGHEIVVPLPVRPLAAGDRETLAEAFDSEYARLYGRTIPGQEREVLSWTLTVTARKPASSASAPAPTSASASSPASASLPPASSKDGAGPAAGDSGSRDAPEPATVRPGPRRLRGRGGPPSRAARP